MTKCKESIKANKQKTTALTEVKESLAKQVTEKEVELNDVKSQLLNTQSSLSSTQTEMESLRSKGQQEELQIAEIKMMMHQVLVIVPALFSYKTHIRNMSIYIFFCIQEMITKDEEIGKLRDNLKQTKESLENVEKQRNDLTQDLELAKEQHVALENSLESEKADALQEMSRGKSSALQTLKNELNVQHEKEKAEMMEQHVQEISNKLDLAEREKQVSFD